MEILTGIFLGLSTLVFIGPVFFYLLHCSISRGVLAGVLVSLGIIVGDLIYVLFCLNGLQDFLNKPNHFLVAAITGGLLLVLLGLEHIFKKPKSYTRKPTNSKKSLFLMFLKGFALNFINPFVFAVWVGFTTYAETKFSLEQTPLILGFALMTIFTTDILKAFLAQKLIKFFTQERLLLFRKITGILLLLFSVRLFWMAL